MPKMAHFLGQDIAIGKMTGSITLDNMAIVENPSAFSVLQLFQEQIINGDESAVFFGHELGIITFALAYNRFETQYDGTRYTTWIKVARDNVSITDSDRPPTRYTDSYNSWVLLNYFTPDNIINHNSGLISDMLNNSFTIYQLEETLYPYWNGANDYTYPAILGGGANFCICLDLYEVHDNVHMFVGATPIRIHGTSFTNYLDDGITTTYPTYTFSNSIGMGFFTSHFIYNPLNIDESEIIESFLEDTATDGQGYNTSYTSEGGNVGFPAPLEYDAIDTGFLTLFTGTRSMIRALADYLWTSDFWTNIKKLWTEPMDSIISFGVLPIDLSPISSNTSSEVKVGDISTGVNLYKLTSQRISLDLGSVSVKEKFGGALDYEPFTKAQIYMPFLGFIPMKVNEITSADSITINYNVDVLSGDFCAQIKIAKYNTKYQHTLDSVLYEYQGNCLIKLPISARDFSGFYKNLVSGGFNMVSGIAGGASIAGSIANGIGGATDAILDGPDIQKSGSCSGSGSALCMRTPFIVLTRPNQQLPPNYGSYVGFPSYNTKKLGELTGFTLVEDLIDNTVKATDAEKQEIEKLLKEGVIL